MSLFVFRLWSSMIFVLVVFVSTADLFASVVVVVFLSTPDSFASVFVVVLLGAGYPEVCP